MFLGCSHDTVDQRLAPQGTGPHPGQHPLLPQTQRRHPLRPPAQRPPSGLRLLPGQHGQQGLQPAVRSTSGKIFGPARSYPKFLGQDSLHFPGRQVGCALTQPRNMGLIDLPRAGQQLQLFRPETRRNQSCEKAGKDRRPRHTKIIVQGAQLFQISDLARTGHHCGRGQKGIL